MQTVELNLASRPFKNDTLLWVGFALGAALLGWLSWWNVDTFLVHRGLLVTLDESESSMRQRFTELEGRDVTALRSIEGFDLASLSVRSEKANEVIRWKSFSWTELFNRLQEIQPWNVQMESISPVFRAAKGRRRAESLEDLEQVPVSVDGVSKKLEDFFELERNLIFDPHFDRVEPDRVATDENSGETVFRLRFLYDPRGVPGNDADHENEAPADEDGEDDAETVVAESSLPPADEAAVVDSGEDRVAEAASVEHAAKPTSTLASDASLQRITRGAQRDKAPEIAADADESAEEIE